MEHPNLTPNVNVKQEPDDEIAVKGEVIHCLHEKLKWEPDDDAGQYKEGSQDSSPQVQIAGSEQKHVTGRRKNDESVFCMVYSDDVGTTLPNTANGNECNQTFSICERNTGSGVTGSSCGLQSHVKVKSHQGIISTGEPCVCLECEAGLAYCCRHKIKQQIMTYKCDVCGAGFPKEKGLKSHKRTHTGDKPHQCDVCSARFYDSSALTKHTRKHTGEKPYKCDVCGAGFSESSSLKKHMRTHTGEKPYKCGVCGASFSQHGHLNDHRRRHTGERPYACDVCAAAFYSSSNLKGHMRTHTGEKPYKCDVCGAAFTCRSNLNTHIRTHTREKPYKCDVCGASFSQYSGIIQHLRKHT